MLFPRSFLSMPIALLFALGLIASALTVSAHDLVTRTVDGRDYLAYLPEDYATRTEPMQVLLALHPATFDAASFQNMSRFETELAAADIIVLYPYGSSGIGGIPSWDAADPRGISRGDEAFLLAVMDDIATVAPIKPKFAITGFSAGSLMTYRMLCNYEDRFSAAVPYAAYYNDNVILNSAWPTTVPLMHMHGVDDPSVKPITGEGDADHLFNFGILSAHMDAVASRNTGAIAATDFTGVEAALVNAEVTVVNEATAYALIDGIGHYWPRSFNGNGPNGAAAVLAFINQFDGDSSPTSPYDIWAAGYPELTDDDALPGADPDGDRLPNLIELVLGTDPRQSNLGEPEYPDASVDGDKLRISFRVAPENLSAPDASSITFFGLTNGDLGNVWNTVTPIHLGDDLYAIEASIVSESASFLKLAAAENDFD